MRRFLASLVLLCGLVAHVGAQQFFAVPGFLQAPMQATQIWGGGFMVGQDNLSPSAHLFRADSFGAYLVGNDSKLHQLITSSSFSTAACDSATGFTHPGSCFGFYPAIGTSQTYQGVGGGVLEMCASPAPGGANTAFMYYGGYLYKSTDIDPANPDSEHWHNTNEPSFTGGGFTKTADTSNGANRMSGRSIACDPNDKDHVIVGTQTTGIFQSTDGGSTFTQIATSDIPLATSGLNYRMAFDQSSGTCGSVTCTIYIFSAGSGLYVSTTGGGSGSWSLITATGGPTTMQHVVVQACAPIPCAGTVFATNTPAPPPSSGNLYSYSGGASGIWTIALASCCTSVAINPLNSQQVVGVVASGQLFTSSAGGGSGSFSAQLGYTLAAGDTPWQATIATNLQGASAGDIAFDQAVNGKLWCNCGQGIFTTSFPTANFVYASQVAGVMQPIGGFLISPKAGIVVSGLQDLGSCTFNIAALPPTGCLPLNQGKSLSYASGLAQSVTDQNFMVMKNSVNFGNEADWSGFSKDFFQQDYHPFNSWEARVIATNITSSVAAPGKVHVSLAGTGSTTAGLSAYSAGPPQTGDILCSFATVFVTGNAFNFGPAQTSCYPIANVTTTDFDFPTLTYASALTTLKAPDGVTPGNYVFYRPTPALSNFGGAQNVIGTAPGAGGAIQVTYLYPAAATLTNGMPVWISGVAGTTEANGEWIISGITTGVGNATFLLVGSTYTNAYTGGGVAQTFGEPGGSIAAASDTNIAVFPSNGGTPQCSLDRGKTWSPSFAQSLTLANTINTTVTGGPYTTGATTISVAATDSIRGANSTQMRVVMDDGRMFFDIVASVTPASGPGTVTLHTGSTMTGATISNGSGGPGNILAFTSATGAVAPNQALIGGTVAANTTIVSGSGLSWIVSGAPQLVASTTMTGTHTIPPGRSISAGAAVYLTTGWPQAASSEQLVVAADPALPNTFYAVNTLFGLVKWTNCDPATIVNTGNANTPGGWQNLGGFGSKIKAVPGEFGHLVYTTGPQGSPTGFSTLGLFRSCNGGVDFTFSFKGVYSAHVVGFGKPRIGGSGYASIIYWGWYDPTLPTPTGSAATWGEWESTDDPNHGVSGSCMAGATFHQICTDGSRAPFGSTCPNGSWPAAFPGSPGWMPNLRDVTGDHDIYGPVYTSTSAGTFYQALPQ